MSVPSPLLSRSSPCGKDLAEEGEIIEDSGSSVPSTPKHSKEPNSSHTGSTDRSVLSSINQLSSAADSKPCDAHHSDSKTRRHRSSTDQHSSSRHRSRSRDSKRIRGSNDRGFAEYFPRDHRGSSRDESYRRSLKEYKQSSNRSRSRSLSRSRHRSHRATDLGKSDLAEKAVESSRFAGSSAIQPSLKPKFNSSRLETSKTDRNKKDSELNDTFELDLEDPAEKENRLIEERRKRRQAILEKHKHLRADVVASSPAPSITSELAFSPSNNSPIDLSKHYPCSVLTPAKSDTLSPSVPTSPDNDCLAADYNPNEDRIADSRRLEEDNDERDFLKSLPTTSAKNLDSAGLSNRKEVASASDDFDMFGDNFSGSILNSELNLPTIPTIVPSVLTHNPSLQDNWDDPEGYYRITLGEVLNERYHVFSVLGKGVFSSVVKAKDTLDSDKSVAIKIIRSNETMHRLGMKEIDILKKLGDADPKNKRHVIRLYTHFEYRGHLCLVFESLSMNLREVLKKFGKDVGIAIKAVRVYAQQLFTALSLLEKCNIIHADIKPDNILVSDSHNNLKLCDLGSASYSSDNEITPYLVSRYYRAPEIILGLPYDSSIDVWSAACSLFEIYTGKILFPGRTNNHMLKLMIDLKGRFSNKLVKRGGFSSQHFDEDFNFLFNDNNVIKKFNISKHPQKELKQRVMGVTANATEDELRMTHLLVDFLDKCLQLNPEHRLSVREALSHPFLH